MKNLFLSPESMWIIHTKYYVKSFDKDTKEKERKSNYNKGLTKVTVDSIIQFRQRSVSLGGSTAESTADREDRIRGLLLKKYHTRTRRKI